MKAVLFAALLVASPAAAQDWRDYDFQSIRVDTSALDLSTPAGLDELERRVGKAVNRLCGSDRYCRDMAWDSAEDQVAYEVARDVRMRRMANEREAQLDRCGGYDCMVPARHWQPAPPPPPPPPRGSVTVIIDHSVPMSDVQVYHTP